MKRKAIAYLLGAALLSLTVFGVLRWYNRIGETTITAAPEPAAQEESAPLESPPSKEHIPQDVQPEPPQALAPATEEISVPEAVPADAKCTQKPCLLFERKFSTTSLPPVEGGFLLYLKAFDVRNCCTSCAAAILLASFSLI